MPVNSPTIRSNARNARRASPNFNFICFESFDKANENDFFLRISRVLSAYLDAIERNEMNLLQGDGNEHNRQGGELRMTLALYIGASCVEHSICGRLGVCCVRHSRRMCAVAVHR